MNGEARSALRKDEASEATPPFSAGWRRFAAADAERRLCTHTLRWIPAYAGMIEDAASRFRGND